MIRSLLACLALTATFAADRVVLAQIVEGDLISEEVANQFGLHRAWATRIQLDPGAGRVGSVVQQGLTLFVQTTQGTVQAIDAETGRTLWATTVGKPGFVTTPACANAKYVAVVNGSTLYLLDRQDGSVVRESRMTNSASAGGVMSDDYVYIPVVNGGLETYKLDPKNTAEAAPLSYIANGTPTAAPIIRGERIMWGSQLGYIYVDDLHGSSDRLYIKTDGPILDSVAYLAPLVYATSRDGYAYALDEKSGSLVWRYPAGSDIRHRPVVLGDAVYVLPEPAGMVQLNSKTGAEQWWARGVSQFVAGSPTRLYVADPMGQLVILDARTGTRLATLATQALPLKVVNTATDRLYLGTPLGMLQCLHEIELTEPVHHDGTSSPAARPATPQRPAAPAATEPAAPTPSSDDPFN